MSILKYVFLRKHQESLSPGELTPAVLGNHIPISRTEAAGELRSQRVSLTLTKTLQYIQNWWPMKTGGVAQHSSFFLRVSCKTRVFKNHLHKELFTFPNWRTSTGRKFSFLPKRGDEKLGDAASETWMKYITKCCSLCQFVANICIFLNPLQAKLTCYFLGFAWAELNKYMQKLHWKTSINITSNYAPITIAFWCSHLSAQYSERNYDQLWMGRKIQEKKWRKNEASANSKISICCHMHFGGSFCF